MLFLSSQMTAFISLSCIGCIDLHITEANNIFVIISMIILATDATL